MTAITARLPAFCRRTLSTVSSVALIAAFAAPALAADADSSQAGAATAPETQEGDIVVSGQRTAELRALQVKQRANNTVETLVADDVGKLPDQNVAEAVKRLPGLSVANDQGEGRYVIIRGVNPNLVNVTVNGQTQPAPEPEGRQVKLDDLPSAMIQSVTVTKSLTPDQDANAIGGAVDIRTLSAFDRKQDFFIAGRGEIGRYNINGEHPWSVDGQVGGKFGANKEFGIVVSGSYSKRPIESENFQGSTTFDSNGRPDQYGLRDYNLVRERTGIVVNLDYQPSPAVKLYLRGTYSKFTDHEFRDQNRVDSLVYTGTTSGNFTGRPSVLIRLRNEDDNTKSISGGGTFKTGNGGQLDVSAAYARAIKDDPLRSEFNFRGNTTSRTATPLPNNGRNIVGTYDVTASPYLFADAFATDYALSSVNYDTRHAQEDLWQARADYTLPVAIGDDSSIKLGVKYLDRHKVNDRNILAYTGSSGFTLAGSGAAYTGDTSFYDGAYVFGPRINYDAAQAYALAHPGLLSTNVSSTVGNSLANDYDVREKIWAGYAMATLQFGKFTLVPGVRVEHTQDSTQAKAFTIGATLAASSPTNLAFNTFGDKSYTNVTPGLNLKYEATDNLLIRGAVTSSIGRPNYADLAPYTSVDASSNPTTPTVLLGNPALKPYKAWNLDASIEYYLPNKGVISIGAFYKHLDNPIYSAGETLSNVTYAGQTFASAQVTQPINVDQAVIYGVEFNVIYPFAFLPSPLDGLGMSANLTLVGGHGDGGPARAGEFPLFFQSKTVGNAQLTYEKYGVTARLAYSYRSKYLDTLGANAATDQYTDSNGQLDARIGYEVFPGAEFYVEGTNLTNAPWRRFIGVQSQLVEREQYGASYRVGVQLKF